MLDEPDDNTWQARMGPRPKREPTLELIERCWQALHLSSGRILSCGIFRTDTPGVEVRAGYSDAQLLRSQHAMDVEQARAIAEEWRKATAAHGAFTKLDGEPFA